MVWSPWGPQASWLCFLICKRKLFNRSQRFNVMWARSPWSCFNVSPKVEVPVISTELFLLLLTPRLINTNTKERLFTKFIHIQGSWNGRSKGKLQTFKYKDYFLVTAHLRELHIFIEFKQSWPLIENGGQRTKSLCSTRIKII